MLKNSFVLLPFIFAPFANAEPARSLLINPFISIEGKIEHEVINSLLVSIRLLDTKNYPDNEGVDAGYNFVFVSATNSIVDGYVQRKEVEFLPEKSISAILSSKSQTQSCYLTRLNYRDGLSTIVTVFSDDKLEVVGEEMMECFSRGLEILYFGDEPAQEIRSWHQVIAKVISLNME